MAFPTSLCTAVTAAHGCHWLRHLIKHKLWSSMNSLVTLYTGSLCLVLLSFNLPLPKEVLVKTGKMQTSYEHNSFLSFLSCPLHFPCALPLLSSHIIHLKDYAGVRLDPVRISTWQVLFSSWKTLLVSVIFSRKTKALLGNWNKSCWLWSAGCSEGRCKSLMEHWQEITLEPARC